LIKLDVLKNRALVYASIVSIIATILIIYTPASIIFGTTTIPYWVWFVSIILGTIVIIAFDIIKVVNNLRNNPLN